MSCKLKTETYVRKEKNKEILFEFNKWHSKVHFKISACEVNLINSAVLCLVSLLFWNIENIVNVSSGIFKSHPCYVQVTKIKMSLAFHFTEL